jgi:hypothetical protein
VAPACIKAPAVRIASLRPRRKVRKGMSATITASGAPRRTAAVCSTIISGVAWTVEGRPCTTMAALSPTRMASASEAATMRAIAAS